MKFVWLFVVFALSANLLSTSCINDFCTNSVCAASISSGASDGSCRGHGVHQVEVSTVEAEEVTTSFLQTGLLPHKGRSVFNQLGTPSALEVERGSIQGHSVSGNTGRHKRKSLIKHVLGKGTTQALGSGLLTIELVAISCTALAYMVYIYDRQAFKRETVTDSALLCISLTHFFSVLCSSIMVPASFEVMVKLEARSAVSGMYVGIYNFCWGTAANGIVYVLMLQFPQLWQTGSWKLLWSGVALQFTGILVYNLILLDLDVAYKLPQTFLQISAVSTRAIMGIGAGIISYVWRFLIVHLVPADKRPQANLLIPFVTLIGNGLGPLVLALAQFGSTSGEHVFICDGAPLLLFVPVLAFLTAQFPSLEEVQYQKVEVDKSTGMPTAALPPPAHPAPVPRGRSPKGRRARRLLGGCPAGCRCRQDVTASSATDVPLSRKVLLAGCVAFSSLWGVAFGGLEVAMVQILTDDFGLAFAVTSALIACTILAVVPLKLMFNQRALHLSSWIHLLMGMSVLGAFMLLNIHVLLPSNLAQICVLLMADMLIFPAFSFAWGLCDGIALEHAANEGWFAASSIILLSQIGFCGARLLGSILSRTLLTAAGRQTYALGQISITVMAWLLAAFLILPNINEKADIAGHSSLKSPSIDQQGKAPQGQNLLMDVHSRS